MRSIPRQKPPWLHKRVDLAACGEMQGLLREMRLATVCEQAHCPNIGECFGRGEATFLILGSECTRCCSFCNVRKGDPGPLDPSEPSRVAAAVAKLGLRHAVITSVTRDDLSDGGAAHFAETVRAVRRAAPRVVVELLIPDFKGDRAALAAVAASGARIIGHNVETVPSLYPPVRPEADYARSLAVLRTLKELAPRVRTKSGIMLGLGEGEAEVLGVFDDLRTASCEFLSIGQYLAPSARHYPVREYIPPERFDFFKEAALDRGFSYVASGPYVRSSYLAEEYLRNGK